MIDIIVLILGVYSVIDYFKAFLERQVSKDKPKPTALLAVKMWNLYYSDGATCHLSYI